MSMVGPLRVIAFMVFVLVLAGSVAFSRAVNKAFIPESLSLLPADFSVALITGPPNELVQALANHFEDDSDAGSIAEFVAELEEMTETLQEDGVELDRALTLGIGFGASLPEAVADEIDRDGDGEVDAFSFAYALPVMLLLPVKDSLKYTTLLTEQLSEIGEAASAPDALRCLAAVQYDVPPPDESSVYEHLPIVAVPVEQDLVVLSTAPGSVVRGIEHRHATRDFLLSDDALLTTMQRTLRGPPALGATVFGYWNAYDMPLLDGSGFSIEVAPEAIRGEFVVNVQSNGLKILDRLLQQSPAVPSWSSAMPLETAAFLALQDEELQPYFDLLKRFEHFSDSVDDTYLGLTQKIRRVDGLHRIVAAIVGFDRGLPELMLGIWADDAALDAALLDFALEARRNRDIQVIEAAAKQFAMDNGSDPTVERLLRAGMLQPEDDNFLNLYTLRREGWESDITEEDLLQGGYKREYGEHTIRYLTPEVTNNDQRTLNVPVSQPMHDDRYRLAFAKVDGVTWVATDAREIELLVDRVQNDTLALDDSIVYKASESAYSRFDKIRGYVNIDQVVRLGLLSPEAAINDAVKSLLAEFRQHPGIGLGVAAKGDRLAGTFLLTHRDGLSSQ